MFTMDVPYVPAQQTPIVLAQVAPPGAGATPQPDFIFKACTEVEHVTTAFSGVDPAYGLKNFIQDRDRHYVDLAAIKITLLQSPSHGELTPGVSEYAKSSYTYDPEPDYIGKDRAVFMAEFEGKHYKIVVDIVVVEQVVENPVPAGEKPVCPPPQLIKVNGKPVSGSSNYDLNSNPVTFTDLAGAALGQTNASGITLDTNAAGYNWFIDTTPSLNEEFLPTSNPNEWVAKAGSEAAGKMDMLSVLLHEYGHALGIDHSADPNDFMGTTLTAGVRRLPSAEEMALMQSLVAQAKGSLTPTLSQNQ